MSPQLIIAGLVAVGVAAVGFALASGTSAAEKRVSAVGGEERKSNAVAIDRLAKKKQVATSLKEIDRKASGKKADLETQIQQAGLTISKQQYIIYSVGAGLLVGALIFVKSGSAILAGAFMLMAGLGLPRFVMARLKKRRI